MLRTGRLVLILFTASVANLPLLMLPATAVCQPLEPFIIRDGDLQLSDWQINPGTFGTATHEVERVPFGGNSGAFWLMTYSYGYQEGVTGEYIYLGQSYDPATQGAIVGLGFYDDQAILETGDGVLGSRSMVILQDGTVYGSFSFPFMGPADNQWLVFRSQQLQPCLVSASFQDTLGSSPDFSASGSPIQFGFRRSMSNFFTPDARSTVMHGMDNFRVVVYRDAGQNCNDEPADVRIDKDDAKAAWGADKTVSYDITVSNKGRAAATNLLIVDQVPLNTTFNAAVSEDGWQCSPDSKAGAECTFPIPTLTGFVGNQTVIFAVDVNPATDALADIYNQTSVDSVPADSAVRVDLHTLHEGKEADQSASAGKRLIRKRLDTDQVCTPFERAECYSGAFSEACCFATVLWAVECHAGGVSRGAPGLIPRAEPAAPALPGDGFLLYRIRDSVFAMTKGGRRATELYYRHSRDMVQAAISAPSLIGLARASLDSWEPNLRTLSEGRGATALVTQAQVDGLNAFLDALAPAASVGLSEAIGRERPRLDLASWVGITMEEALAKLDLLGCEGSEHGWLCGDSADDGNCRITASDALTTLQAAVGSKTCDLCLCDVNGSGGLSATDSLMTLQAAVGLPVELNCIPCP